MYVFVCTTLDAQLLSMRFIGFRGLAIIFFLLFGKFNIHKNMLIYIYTHLYVIVKVCVLVPVQKYTKNNKHNSPKFS